MPMHDWSGVEPGIFHAFHQSWTVRLCDALNSGYLPKGFYSLIEWKEPPRFFTDESETDCETYTRKANRIMIRRNQDDAVAAIEFVSPGDHGSVRGLRKIVDRVVKMLQAHINVLIVDPFPSKHNGVHAAIWKEYDSEPFVPPADQPLTLVAYECDEYPEAYIEPFAVGEKMLDMPLFLEPGFYVMVPLEETYTIAFNAMPERWRNVLQPPTP